MTKRLLFDDTVKDRWIIKRDDNHDHYIALNGKKALGQGGLDHIYLIGPDKLGLWITTRQIRGRIKVLTEKVPGLAIEMLGDGEALLSIGIEHLDKLCVAARAKARRHVSEAEKQRLRQISPFVSSVPLCNSPLEERQRPNGLSQGNSTHNPNSSLCDSQRPDIVELERI